MSLTYNVRQTEAAAVVDLSGRIGPRNPVAAGSGGTTMLHELIRDLVEHGHKKILLNLRDVTSVDSAGIGELFGSYTTVRNQGGVLKLANPNERVQNVIRLTKLDTVVELIEDEATALRSFSKEKAQRGLGTYNSMANGESAKCPD